MTLPLFLYFLKLVQSVASYLNSLMIFFITFLTKLF